LGYREIKNENMKQNYLIYLGSILLLFTLNANSQNLKLKEDKKVFEESLSKNVDEHINQSYQMVKNAFNRAYQVNPEIPRGILEAVSFNYTRFTHRSFIKSTDDAGIGMPRTYGVMGLTLDGQNYFRNNLSKISFLSGISVAQIISNPEDNVMAYAKAFKMVSHQKRISSKNIKDYIPVLIELCELPINKDIQNDYAMSTFLYGIFDFLNQSNYSIRFGFPIYKLDLKKIFGDNYFVLSSKHNVIDGENIETESKKLYRKSSFEVSKSEKSTDYGPAIWNAAASCNYSSGRSSTISAIAVHYTAGSYAGSISWFQNCAAQSSAHYVLRSSDGQITQMVREADKAWHVRDENPYTIGFEHEAIEPVQNYFTVAMYQASAALIRDICASGYGISPLRMFYRDTLDDGTVLDYGLHSLGAEGSCVKIKGHQHFPNNTHTDPGPFWNWDYYFKQVNNTTPTTTYNTPTGTFTDDGGATANYSVDNRMLYLIEVPDASHITLNFSQFALETNYDFLYIYDGNSVYSPKIGRYNTISPGSITSSGNQLLIEFRSDCATTAAGWVANWTSVTADNTSPTTLINQTDSLWITDNYTCNFSDADNVGGSGINQRFYQIMYHNGLEWTANQNHGFAVDNFDIYNTSKWKIPVGNVAWSVASSQLQVLDTNTDNSNIYTAFNGELSNTHIYDFYAKIDGTSTNKRFGFHFACDSATLSNRGNSYFIYIRPGSSQLEFYRVVNNTFTQTSVVTGVVTNLNQYYHYKIVHNRILGSIEVYRDDQLIGSWTDPTPLTTSSKYFSFRTARTQAWIKLMRVYRSRAASASITVGAGDTDIPIQSKNSNVMAKVKSWVNDQNNNYSSLISKEMRVDWTKPALVTVNDGLSSDLDIFGTQGIIRGNWSAAIDTNSGIQRYKYAIGTSVGATNIVGWTDNGMVLNFEKTGLTFVDGTTYYIMVKSQNGAGLWSDSVSSDGAVFHLQSVADFSANTQQICTGGTVQFTNLSANITGQTWYFTGGTPSVTTLSNPLVTYPTSGVYSVKLVVTGGAGVDSVIRTSYISVQATPTFPSVIASPIVCQGSSTTLEVSGSATLTWYESISGGTILGTGATYTTPLLNSSTSYFVRSEIGSCFSTMTTVNATVEPMPALPQLSTSTPICSETSTQLTATGTSLIKWYSDAQANNQVAAGAIFNTPSLSETTTYYARTETAHCITNMANTVVVVNPIPPIPTVNSSQTSCYGLPVQLNAQGEAILNWYSSTSSSPIGTGDTYTTSPMLMSDTFYVQSHTNGCNSPFAQIAIIVFDLPAQPIISLVSGELCSNVDENNQWFLDGVAIDTATSQCYNPIQDGNYTLQITNANGCLSPFSAIYPFSSVEILNLSQNQNFNIYPNPTTNKLNVILPSESKVHSIQLVDALGQIIYQQLNSIQPLNSVSIDMTKCNKGLYFLIIEDASTKSTTKVIKE